MTWQLSSESCTSKRSAPDVSVEMICPMCVVGLRVYNCSSHVCVDTILVQLGCSTLIGVFAILLLKIGASSIR